jgi:hypothetical protein
VADAERANYRRLNGGRPLDGVVAHLCFSERIARQAHRALAPGGVLIARSFHADMWKEAGRVDHFAMSARAMRRTLQEAGYRVGPITIERRKQSFRSFAHFEEVFLKDPARRGRWEADGRLEKMARHLARGGGDLSEAFLVVAALKRAPRK